MTIEQHITEIGEFLASVKSRLTIGQRYKAKHLFENLINSMDKVYQQKERLEMQVSGMPVENYASTFQKAIALIDIMGFNRVEFSLFDKRHLDFILKNIESISKGPLTHERITGIIDLIKFFELENDRMPEKMSELTEPYNRIKKEHAEQDNNTRV